MAGNVRKYLMGLAGATSLVCLLLLGACGDALVPKAIPSCGPASCKGCCKAGVCVESESINACGWGGQFCSSCSSGESCSYGLCRPDTKNEKCNSSNCQGCCSGGICNPGVNMTSCGAAGNQCVACSVGQVCDQGRCQAGAPETQSCNGCVSGPNCLPGTSASACGKSGLNCEKCGSNEICSQGSCQSTTPPPADATCSALNCAGCCNSIGQCVGLSNQGPSLCGNTGDACQACDNSTPMCSAAGICTADDTTTPPDAPPPPPNTPPSTPDNPPESTLTCEQTCSGCCQGGTCVEFSDQFADGGCGNSGQQCGYCNAPHTICKQGQCHKPVCDATTCSDGCCNAAGDCVKYTDQRDFQCGAAGAACSDCTANPTDNLGCESATHSCQPLPCSAYCNGCCTSTGQCLDGDIDTACGGKGALCDNCGMDATCAQNSCLPLPQSTNALFKVTLESVSLTVGAFEFCGEWNCDLYVKLEIGNAANVTGETSVIEDSNAPSWYMMMGIAPADKIAEHFELKIMQDNWGPDQFAGKCDWGASLSLKAINGKTVTLPCHRPPPAKPGIEVATATVRFEPY
jgi:hypothetical protein